MRYFAVITWAGRLRQRSAPLPSTWNPAAVRFEDEAAVARILSMMPTDRMVRSIEEVDALVHASAGEQISRVLWVPEEMLQEIQARVEATPAPWPGQRD